MGLSSAAATRRSLSGALLTAGLVGLMLLLLPGTALAAGSRRIGNRPSVPSGAQAVGALAQSIPLTVTVTLQPRDPAALDAYAQAVSTPGSSVYHQYLSVDQFAARFGPTPAQIAAARGSLHAQGLTAGPLAADGLSFPVTAASGRLASAFDTGFERYHLRDGRTAYANTSAPQVSGTGASVIQGVIGLNNLAMRRPTALEGFGSAAVKHSAKPRASASSAVTACGSAASSFAYTANQIASAYGFDALYSAGDEGGGQTVALYELEPYSGGDVGVYQSCYGTDARITNVNVDGGAGCDGDPDCGLEDVLDIEDVIGLVPKASIRVYEGPNTNAGAYDTYQRIVTDDAAKVISTSWGECEAEVGSSAADAENTLFEEAAAQGQTVLAAAGDNGTTDCVGTGGKLIKQRAVDDPASQPYVTGVGGTSLTTSPFGETVWDHYPTAGLNGGAGGGGVSTLWTQPSYQSGFAQSQSSILCGTANHTCREVPDVSADADPNTGYAIYYTQPGYPGSWGPVGGTSAAAPTWASLVALAESSSYCGGAPLGFVNPLLYKAAAPGTYAADFNDVQSGNNNYDGVTGFSAGTGYDMASGLGSPKGAALAATICAGHDAVKFTGKPASRRTVAGTRAPSFTVSATSSQGKAPIHYGASHLPPGVSIGSTSGTVSGTPKKAGTYSVLLRAIDHFGTTGTVSLTWAVTRPTVVLRAVRRQTATKGVYKRVALHASDSAKAKITYKASGLPHGLSIDHRTGVISGRPAKVGSFRVTVRAVDAFGGRAKRQFTLVVKP